MGFWGAATATLDWCEENYLVSYFIAEFWNTVSNLGFIFLSLFGIWQVWHYGLEFRYALSHAGILLVGIGSWMFHASLLYQYQLLDELPMIYGTCVFVFCLIEDSPHPKYPFLVAAGLFLYAATVTVVYLQIHEPIFHQVAYAVLVGTVVLLCLRSLRKLTREKKSNKYFYFWISSIIFYFAGFALWNIDNIFCAQLRELRSQVGIFSPVFQLHAWWHILTAIGTYEYVVFSMYLRVHTLKHHGLDIGFIWGIPALKRISSSKSTRKSR